MGNITSLALGTVRTASFVYSGTLPKLTSVTETGFGTRSVTYDPTGNETQVGTGVFAYSSRNYLSSGDGLTYTYDGRGLRTMVVNSDVTPAKRYFFYSPEMNLLSESELTTLPAPVIQNDYIWFNGHPVGQINGGTQWTFTDHLGTPLIQTSSTGDVFWRAEHEPYGKVFSLRTAPQHQPLRLPGQESEELNLSADGNGASERFYNIFRWYRYGWGRYTQSDPLGIAGGIDTYAYVFDGPIALTDPVGLRVRVCCKKLYVIGIFRHCYLEFDDGGTTGLHGSETPGGYVRALFCGDIGKVEPDNWFDQFSPNQKSCGAWSEDPCRDPDECVREAAMRYPASSRYCLFGPNSNTFASWVTRQCHLQPPGIAGTWHTPGWKSPAPLPVLPDLPTYPLPVIQ